MARSPTSTSGAPRFDLILVGFGNVGRRLVRLLDELGPALAEECGFTTRVIGIATRSRGSVFDESGLGGGALASRFEAGEPIGSADESPLRFLRDALNRSIAVARSGRLIVVELTTLDVATGRPAIEHVQMALQGGAHVVTANKGPAAFAYRQLADEAARADRRFLFESAVMDGIPLFNLKRATLPAVTVTGFRGVVNSTTNYILTAMERGETFTGALEAMQLAGIAEADASLDVDGWDAAAKTAIIANTLLDGDLTPHTVEREGLSAAAADRITSARRIGRRLKLVASGERAGNVVRGRVCLVELPETDLLAQLEGQQNAVLLQTDLLGEIAIVQRGGGLTQTAYGVVSDIAAIAGHVSAGSNLSIARQRGLPRARRDRTLSGRGRR